MQPPWYAALDASVSAITVAGEGTVNTAAMRWPTALLLSGVLTTAGCGVGDVDADPGASAGSTASSTPAAEGTGEVADLAFTATTLDGHSFEGEELEGRPVVLWFWSPWCPTCRAQSSTVAELAEQHADDVEVVGVGGLDEPDAIREVAAQIPGVQHLLDEDGSVWRHFGVTAQSTYMIISADGGIVAEGYLDNDELTVLVDEIAG